MLLQVRDMTINDKKVDHRIMGLLKRVETRFSTCIFSFDV